MCQGDSVEQPPEEASMGQASTIGLDIAKWVFQAHGADATGRVVFRKRLVRAKVLEFFAGQPPCLVALARIIHWSWAELREAAHRSVVFGGVGDAGNQGLRLRRGVCSGASRPVVYGGSLAIRPARLAKPVW